MGDIGCKENICLMTKLSKLEPYEEVYYSFQTQARGLLRPEELIAAFDQKVNTYDEMFFNILPTEKNVKCIDCGCGYGNFLYYLCAKGYTEVTGFDLDPIQVSLAVSLGLNAKIGNAIQEIAKMQNIGLISALDFIEHLDKNQAVCFLQSALRALIPDGMLILRCPCADGFSGSHDFCNDLTHKWNASSNMLRQLLKTVGFDRIQILDQTVPPFPGTFARRLFFRLRRAARKVMSPLFLLLGIVVPEVWHPSQIAIAYKPC